jgi:hypothetical protein
MAALICSAPKRERKSLSVKTIMVSHPLDMTIGRAMAIISPTPPLLAWTTELLSVSKTAPNKNTKLLLLVCLECDLKN